MVFAARNGIFRMTLQKIRPSQSWRQGRTPILTIGPIQLWGILSWLARCRGVAEWRLSTLKFRVRKIRTDSEGQKTPTNQISASNHVWFSRNKIFENRLSFVYELLPNSNLASSHITDRRFYFSRTKHDWKLKFGLWGSSGILNQYEIFSLYT